MFSIIRGRRAHCPTNGHIYVNVRVVTDNRTATAPSASISKNETSISIINSVCVLPLAIVLSGSGWPVACPIRLLNPWLVQLPIIYLVVCTS